MSHESASLDEQLHIPEQLLPVPVTVAEVEQFHPGQLDTFLKGDDEERVELRDGFTLSYEGMVTHCLQFTDEVDDYQGKGRTVSKGIVFIDQDEGGDFAGYGEADVRYHLDYPASNDGLPFVGYTETDKNHLRQGLGKRRLKLMNEVTKHQFGTPLHSDLNGSTEEEAAATWQSLVKDGLAEEVEGMRKRWRFKDGSHT